MSSLREVHIIDHLYTDLYANGATHLVSEVGVIRGGSSRIDLLDFSKDIHGYEIKTHVDSLSRLKTQIPSYGKVLSRVTLVAATKHLKKAKTLIPGYWGLKEIVEHDGFFSIVDLKEAEPNPEQDKLYLASLLWADELTTILKRIGQYRQLASKAHWNMANRLSILYNVEELTSLVVAQLAIRSNQVNRGNPWKLLPMPYCSKASAVGTDLCSETQSR